MMPAYIRIGLLLCLAACFCGCREARFYRQAIVGQYQILTRQERIDKLIAKTNTPPELRAKLQRVEEIRHFAEAKLKLPAGSHYRKYADLGRPYVVWNVFAAPELSLKPYTWWYPIVGRASYRGFFAEADARDYARQLEEQGYDVCIGGVPTYSTLGWFEDPILNTFIDLPEADFVDTVFHELAHQKLFVPGDTEFNEAFATSVAQEGVRQWFAAHGDVQSVKKYETEHEQDAEFTRLVLGTIDELQKLYADPSLTIEVRRAGKQRAIEQLRARYEKLKATWHEPAPFDGWIASPINNAKLGTIATYNELAPLFDKVLKSCHGDWAKFYDTIGSIVKLPPDKRRQALSAAANRADHS